MPPTLTTPLYHHYYKHHFTSNDNSNKKITPTYNFFSKVLCTSASIFHISVTAADDETVKVALEALKEGFSEAKSKSEAKFIVTDLRVLDTCASFFV